MPKPIRLAALAGVNLLASCAALLPAPDAANKTLLSGLTLEEVRRSSERSDVGGASHPTIAIALGGGGLRGYAHIGVLQALEESGIVPDIVAGTSVGAIIGAAYASGSAPDKLWQRAEKTKVYLLADVTLGGSGFIKGKALARWTNSLVGNVPIERFPKRFAAVAADLERSEPIALMAGDAGQAARASAAIPGIFSPVPYLNGELVDGGVVSIVPIRTARAMGASIVIGVDVYCHSPRFGSDTSFSAILRVTQVQSCIISHKEMEEADILIAPAVARAGADDAQERERARQAGYDAAKSVISRVKALMMRTSSASVSTLKEAQIHSLPDNHE